MYINMQCILFICNVSRTYFLFSFSFTSLKHVCSGMFAQVSIQYSHFTREEVTLLGLFQRALKYIYLILCF